MKKQLNLTKVIMYLVIAIGIQACAKPKANVAEAPPGAVDPGTGVLPPDGSNTPSATAATVNLNASLAALKAYSGRTTITDNSNVTMYLELRKFSTGAYGGVSYIAYNDQGKAITSHVESRRVGTVNGSKQECEPLKPSQINADSSKHNVWFKENGQDVWHGFFQDCYGAVVIVIDKVDTETLGDGSFTKTLSGSVWFRNFPQGPLLNPEQGTLQPCWNIRAGPYDCRTFLKKTATGSVFESQNWNIVTTSALEPNNGFWGDREMGYEQLGTFTGLKYADVFQ